MLERDLVLESAGARLSGTVCLPTSEGRFPTVLMLHGSGPLDRNENTRWQRLHVFNTIAHHLARAGVASVRYDKRGCGKSSGDYHRAGHTDLVGDAVAWVDRLRTEEFCHPERLMLLGHSEGCIIAAEVGVERPFVAGLILLCPFIQPMETILLAQAKQLEDEVRRAKGLGAAIQRALLRLVGRPTETQAKLLQKVKASSEDVIRYAWQKVTARWLREMLALKPEEVFAQVACPMLLVGGEKDLQCDPADVARIAQVAPGAVEQHVLPHLTHVLRDCPEEHTLLKTATLSSKPVDPRVLELVAAWAGRQIMALSAHQAEEHS